MSAKDAKVPDKGHDDKDVKSVVTKGKDGKTVVTPIMETSTKFGEPSWAK